MQKQEVDRGGVALERGNEERRGACCRARIHVRALADQLRRHSHVPLLARDIQRRRTRGLWHVDPDGKSGAAGEQKRDDSEHAVLARYIERRRARPVRKRRVRSCREQHLCGRSLALLARDVQWRGTGGRNGVERGAALDEARDYARVPLARRRVEQRAPAGALHTVDACCRRMLQEQRHDGILAFLNGDEESNVCDG